MDIRNVVVPLDGSRLAEQALPLACLIARRTEACLRIVSVVPGAGFLDLQDLPSFVGEGIRRAADGMKEYVDGVVARIRRDAYVRTTGIVRIDAPPDGVLKTTEETRADLVVMTSHGRGGFKRFWLGSVTDAVLRRTHVPVLVVKSGEDANPDLVKEPAFDSVAVPLDGSAMGEAALPPALELARALQLPMKLARVVVPATNTLVPGYPGPVLWGIDEDGRATYYLDALVKRLANGEVDVSATVIHDDAVASALVAFAAGSITVLSTNAHAGVGRLLLGSIPDKVVRLSDYPVMVVRAAPHAEGVMEEIAGLERATTT